MERSILIVDDEPRLLTMMARVFEGEAAEVHTAASGAECMALLEQHAPRVMFIDLKLPDIDGLQLCRSIRRRLPGARIYAVTGYHGNFDPERCREAGFDGYISKPTRIELLREVARMGLE